MTAPVPRTFAPAWWATLLMAAGVALTVALGFWQLGRADTKQALQRQIDDYARQPPLKIDAKSLKETDIFLRRIAAHGRFEVRHVVYLDNRLHKHQPGYHVMMPLRLADSDKYVLVNRGWVAAGRERQRAPAVKTPDGDITVVGTATAPSARFLELSAQVTDGNIWQNMALERYREATKLDLLPIILQQTDALDDGLNRDWPPVDLKRNTHLAYAVQWFALAVAIFLYYVVINVRRIPRTDNA